MRKARWFVDDSCIDCDRCWEHFPQVFERSETVGQAYVRRQPFRGYEQRKVRSVARKCPVSAIQFGVPPPDLEIEQ